jgi:hypothetical protein
VCVPPADGIAADGFRSEDLAFQRRIHDLLILLLATPPFLRLKEKVVWLDRRDQHVWGERIFAAVVPLLAAQETPQRALPIDVPAAAPGAD